MIGIVLGHYRVLSKVGEGGMGEVYRARDTDLNRDVALKILPDLFAHDADRVARFRREAQTLAALNHPNIAQIYGIVDAKTQAGAGTDHVHALVMELVDGDDLSAIVARGPMPLGDALAVARQIIDALEAAHEQGIVHRDLKPANIKVRPDGTVKVLDFGLAKAVEPALASSSGEVANSPTMTARATAMGMIIGTATYMAPEQARGKSVDRRADIWAFGAVLYEMLTGRRAFPGDDISDVLAAVLKTDPDWSLVPASAPASIARLLSRCLEKDPRKRLSAIGDARFELDEAPAPLPVAAKVPMVSTRRVPVAALVVGVALATMALTIGATRLWPVSTPPAASAGPVRLGLTIAEGDTITETHMLPLAISPDGSRVAFIAERDNVNRLFLRTLSDRTPVLVADSEGAGRPFFSPDGQWVGFFALGKVKKAAVIGGTVQVVSAGAQDPRGGAWGADGNIYFAPTNASGIWRVPASGGTASELTTLNRDQGEISHRWPHVLPDGASLLFSIWTGPGPDERAIVKQDLATGVRRVLLRGGDTARFLAPGYLLYGRLDTLLAVPWSPEQTGEISAPPVTFPEQPRMENEGASAYAFSSNGTLAYLNGGTARYAQRVVWVDRGGAVETVPVPERDIEAVSLAPDGKRAIVQIREGTMGLWMYDFERRTIAPFATSGGSSQAPAWSADGRWVYFRGTRRGARNVYRKAADGSGEEERLTEGVGGAQTPSSLTPDGRWLVFVSGGNAGVFALRLDGSSKPVRLIEGASHGHLSPDGRWLAFQQEAGGRNDVYVMPFPGPGPRVPISVNGGGDPRWSRDGRELFYTKGDRTFAVPITVGALLTAGEPRLLYTGRFRPSPNAVTAWDVAPDGKRFLRIQQVVAATPVAHIEMVLNWASQLPRLTAGK